MKGPLLVGSDVPGYLNPLGSLGLPSGRLSLALSTGAELLFGAWLIAGVLPRQTRYVAIATFAFFFAIAVTAAVAGQPSCGCFGVVTAVMPVPPWATATLDAACVLALLAVRPMEAEATDPSLRGNLRGGRKLGGFLAVILLAVGLAVARFIGGTSGAVGSTEPLDAEALVGQAFPLLDQIDVADRLRTGSFVLLIYRAGCPECDDAIRRLRRRGPHGDPIALVEIPGPRTEEGHLSPGGRLARGRLRVDDPWSVKTPLLLRLRDGVVTNHYPSVEELLRESPRD